MSVLEYEEEIPEDEIGGGHFEADLSSESAKIHIKKFDEHYESFWYTDTNLDQFIGDLETITEQNPLFPSSEQKEPFVTRLVKKKNYDEIRDISYSHFKKEFDTDELSYFEMEFGSVTCYWAIESPPINDNDLSHIVHVSGSLNDISPFEDLYQSTAPDFTSEKNREKVISSALDYIQDKPTGETK